MHFQVYDLPAVWAFSSLLLYLAVFVPLFVLARRELSSQPRVLLATFAGLLALSGSLSADSYVMHPCAGLKGWAYWLSGCFLVG